MTASVKLTCGAASFDLNSNGYSVGLDFAPPAVNMSYNVTSGTSANVSGGGSLQSLRANARQFSFTVRLLVASLSDAKAKLINLTSFTRSQSNDVMFLEYRENTALPIPLWGQFGAPTRHEIVTCDVGNISNGYTETGRGFMVTISLLIKPLGFGNRQKLINATGGMFENTYGSIDGSAKGLSIFGSVTNKTTNPVFGASTFNTGWTAGGALLVSKNTNPQYCIPGLTQSAKLVATSVENIYQSINVGNTNKHTFSAYLFAPDMGTLTSADVVILYDVVQATTFQNLGNGLWLAYANNITGYNAAKNTGVQVKTGRTVYLAGYQCEENTLSTPLAYGDLLGCAWTGTAHASTSTRTAVNINDTRTDDYLSLAQGAVSVVWKPYYSSGYGAAEALWGTWKTDYSLSGLKGYYNGVDSKFYLEDGNNSIATAAQSFSAGDVMHLCFVWGPSGLAIYKNGSSVASSITYTPPSLANSAVFTIGNINGAYQSNGDLIGFDTYPNQLTQAQASAIYTAQAAIVAGGNRVSSIPWFYTATGVGKTYNHNDSGHQNWGVAGGIPGSWPAQTLLDLQMTAHMHDSGYLYLSLFDTKTFINPSNFYYEAQGTADANSSGGEYETTLLDNGNVVLFAVNIADLRILNEMLGREFLPILRIKDTNATTRSVDTGYGIGAQAVYNGYKSITTSSSVFTAQVGTSMVLPTLKKSFVDNGIISAGTASLLVVIRRDSGGAQNVFLDFVEFLFRPIMRVKGGANGDSALLIDNSNVIDYTPPSTLAMNDISNSGDIIELVPGKYNELISILGNETASMLIATETTYAITITPRYTLA